MFEAKAFSPFETLAADLIPHAHEGDDGSHDLAHILRVFRNAMRILASAGGNARILAAAVLLHDCVAVEKSSPQRAQASALAAEKATGILAGLGWSPSDVSAVAHAVTAHSFSANIEPETIEAKILQDADRLDAIGMVGAGRCFYIGGRMSSALYDPFDPAGNNRPLDDRRYVIDHFQTKLFKLADGFKTDAGRALAAERDKRLRDFLDAFMDEI
jgi:uncharacterized protein